MANTGNRSVMEARADLAKSLDEMMDTFAEGVLAGLMSLSKIHEGTNCLVDHGGAPLTAVIQDKDVLRTYVLALMVELGEFVQTLDWKPWRDVPDKSRDKTLDEFADILAFIGVLLTILKARGISTLDITEAYIAKERVNISRFIAAMESRNAND